ncbi:uncharacterized protein LOC144701008 [Wolffia australiana]
MVDEQKSLDLNMDENLIIQDMDACWDEIYSRLIISGMVSDAIVKGMVNAISEDSMELISSKDEEINELKKRLKVYESGKITDGKLELKTNLDSGFTSSGMHKRADAHLRTLKTGVESIRSLNFHGEELHTLKKMDEAIYALTELLSSFGNDTNENTDSLEDTRIEQQLQWEFERELTVIILQAFQRDLLEEQEASLLNQISISDLQNEHRLEKILGLLGSIQELESILKSICTAEPDCATAETKSGTFEISRSPSTLQTNEEDLVGYYRSEVNSIKRQLESSLHGKTDDLFRLKREVLKDMGSFRWKRDDDFKAMRGNFPDIILKLEKIHMDSGDLIHHRRSTTQQLEAKNLEKLKKEILSFQSSLEANIKSFLEVESRLCEQKGRLDKALDEFKFVASKVNGERNLMSLKARLEEARNQIKERDEKLSEFNQRLCSLSNDLNEVKKENQDLRLIAQHRENEIISAAEKSDEQRRQMDSIVSCVHQLSKSFAEFQMKASEKIEISDLRLKILHHGMNDQRKMYDAVKISESWYRKNFELRLSDLQKAEAEVDILGDEVDALLVILEKIYKTLDYYSPVLLHYPGVVESLKLVRWKLKGNPMDRHFQRSLLEVSSPPDSGKMKY